MIHPVQRPAWIARAQIADAPRMPGSPSHWPRCEWCFQRFRPGGNQSPRKYCNDKCRARMANYRRAKRKR